MIGDGRPFNPRRLAALMGLFGFWSLLIAARAVQFQVFQHEELSDLALKIYEKPGWIMAQRGIIYDSGGAELATNVTVSDAVADPSEIKKIHSTAEKLAPVLGMDVQALSDSITAAASRKRLVLGARLLPDAALRIKELGLRGIYLVDESLRVYPNGNLGSHILGSMNRAGTPVAGVEYRYDGVLKGEKGRVIRKVDAFGRSWGQKVTDLPRAGSSLFLSVNRHIQHLTQRELAAGVKKFRAKGGVAIVMESGSGRILALASFPDFDCNAYGKHKENEWRNRAVQDMFEPGSTFKVVVASVTLDAKLIRLDETIDCQMGKMKVGNHTFHDHEPYGSLTLVEILENSSNIGAAKLGWRLGDKGLYEALRKFGFGAATGIDLPAEAPGKVRHYDKWSMLSIPSISFGQEVGVTSIQMITAINAIANGGYLVRPSVVDRIVNENGETVHLTKPKRVRIIRPETASTIMRAFEGVVVSGTGKNAMLEGYRAAGKTGTAQKAGKGGYSKGKYMASFIGFAPLPRPQVTILVQIDEPRGAIYGGEVAAPIFRKIAQETLLRLQVPPDRSLLALENSSESRFTASDRPGQSLE
ncbi:MAG: penicillin-binding protein 2 [Acidobacteria bacterium]|nr:penicillin-binding protein 2 [Acidobacteriota bacterium]